MKTGANSSPFNFQLLALVEHLCSEQRSTFYASASVPRSQHRHLPLNGNARSPSPQCCCSLQSSASPATLSSVTSTRVIFPFAHPGLSLTHRTSCCPTFVGRVLSRYHTHSCTRLGAEDRAGIFLSSSAFFCYQQSWNFHFRPAALGRKPSCTLPKFSTQGSFCFCINPLPCPASHPHPAPPRLPCPHLPAVLCPGCRCWDGVQRTPRTTSGLCVSTEQLLSHISVCLK